MNGTPSRRAFSLIEVVLALAVMSFALVAVVGLFSVGLQTNKESSDQLQATDLASLLISARRAAPTNVLAGDTFALPRLTNSGTVTSNSIPLNVSLDGTVTNATSSPFKLNYIVSSPPATPKAASVYLLLWWPGTAAKPPTNSPGGYYQVATQIALP